MTLISRRRFGAFLGLGCVAAIVQPVWGGDASKAREGAHSMRHINNRQLFNFASGKIELADWERQHLHECKPCQKMICVLLRQLEASRI